MALLAESLVDEWLNRNGFLTMRGVKQKIEEIDLLGVRPSRNGLVEAWHVEVQVSFRPMNFLTPLSRRLAQELGKVKRAAIQRTPQQLAECTREWVQGKFRDPRKVALRNSIWPDLTWRFILVHGVVKHPQELEFIGQENVELIPLHKVLAELCAEGAYKAAAGGDIADLIQYYAERASATTIVAAT